MRDYITVLINKAKEVCIRAGQWVRRHAVLAAIVLLLLAVISPRNVQGQLPSPCCAILATGLGTINSTLGSVIGGGLRAMNTVLSDISNFEQTVIWPKQAITRALGMAGLIQGFYTQIRGIFQIPIATATLQSPGSSRVFYSRETPARFRTPGADMPPFMAQYPPLKTPRLPCATSSI